MFIVLVYDFNLLVTRKHIWNLSLDVASRVPRDEGRHLCSRPCELLVHESLNMCVYVSRFFCLFVCLCVCVCVCVCVCLFVCILFVQRVWTFSLGRYFSALCKVNGNLHISKLWSCLFYFCRLLPIVYTMFPFKSIPRACAEWGWHCAKKNCPNCTSFTLTVAKSFLPRL